MWPTTNNAYRRLRDFLVALCWLGFTAGVTAAFTPETQVETGLDRLIAEDFASLKGKSIAILTHQAAVDRQGRHLLKTLPAKRNFRIKALLAPEHGFYGELDQEQIGDSLEPNLGLTIYSLYGKTKKPTATMLEGVDLLLIDLFDIGTRFYTYQTTLLYALQACAENGVEVLVLDRPNPIGGVRVAGPVLEKELFAFVGAFEMPIVHGMTLGEMARMFVGERLLPVRLQVMAVAGWQRGDYFPQTGLTWVNPSPNMRTPRQAILYPAIGVLEYTNLSVGRGTDTPFERLGAPWIQPHHFARELRKMALPGLSFTPHAFTPTSGPYAGERCGGIFIDLNDQERFDPFLTSVALAQTLIRLYPQDYQPEKMVRLLGQRDLTQALIKGTSPGLLSKQVSQDLRKFRKTRQKYLQY